MAEFIFKVRDYVTSDPDKDRRGVHKKGDFINFKPDGWSDGEHWGQSAYPYANGGKFILVKCPEITFAEAEAFDHRQPWKDDFDYQIIATRPAQGQYDIRIFEKNPGATNQNSISAAKAIKVRDYLIDWGCSNMSLGTHDANFTFSLWDAVRSVNFWEVPTISERVTFVLNSYSAVTGIGSITATVVQAAWGPFENKTQEQIEAMITRQVTDAIEMRGGTVTAQAYPVFTFEIERSAVLTKFREDVKGKLEETFTRHRFHMSEAEVDTVIAVGGVVTITRTQFLSKLKDKMAE
jgi:hypothetical protein